MKKLMLLSAAVLALQAIPAMAEEGADPGPKGKHGGHERFFEKQDTDKDGAITEAEFLAHSKEKFAKMDTNSDGKVTKEEAKENHEKWKAKRAEMRAKKEAGEAPKAE